MLSDLANGRMIFLLGEFLKFAEAAAEMSSVHYYAR